MQSKFLAVVFVKCVFPQASIVVGRMQVDEPLERLGFPESDHKRVPYELESAGVLTLTHPNFSSIVIHDGGEEAPGMRELLETSEDCLDIVCG